MYEKKLIKRAHCSDHSITMIQSLEQYTKSYSEPSRTSTMEHFYENIECQKASIFAKSSIVDVRLGP